MADPIKDGGPAFPVSTQVSLNSEHGNYGHQDGPRTWQFGGMSLRDYFAATVSDEPASGDYGDNVKAALVGRPCPSLRRDGPVAVFEFEAEFRAKWRLMRADAMLRARENGNG